MELTPTQIDTLTRVTEELGGEVTVAYSGRGMYGSTCVGVTLDGNAFHAIFQIGVYLADEDAELAQALAETRFASDDMGLGTIIYWPNVKAPQSVDA